MLNTSSKLKITFLFILKQKKKTSKKCKVENHAEKHDSVCSLDNDVTSELKWLCLKVFQQQQ